jgi:hypothetical protein
VPSRIAVAPGAGASGDPRDEFCCALSFPGGSVASLLYSASGSSKLPKERLEAFCAGAAYVLDDFVSLASWDPGERTLIGSRTQDKGLQAQWEAFLSAVHGERPWPISLGEQIGASRVALSVEHQLVGR